jgi:hypothetical protein
MGVVGMYMKTVNGDYSGGVNKNVIIKKDYK